MSLDAANTTWGTKVRCIQKDLKHLPDFVSNMKLSSLADMQ